MADAIQSYAIRRLTLDTVSWTAVTPPVGVNRIVITQTDGTNNILMRSDSSSSSSQLTILAQEEKVIQASPGSAMAVAFEGGRAACYLQVAAGTGPAVIEYIR